MEKGRAQRERKQRKIKIKQTKVIRSRRRSMASTSREKKIESLEDTLQQLRDVTNSTAVIGFILLYMYLSFYILMFIITDMKLVLLVHLESKLLNIYVTQLIIFFFNLGLAVEQSLNYCRRLKIHRGVETKSGGTELRAGNRGIINNHSN